MIALSRRNILLSACFAATPSLARADAADVISEVSIGDTLRRYDGFGIKATGGAGDTACGSWIESELGRAGLTVRRQVFDTPFAEMTRSSIRCADFEADLIPQAAVQTTPASGLLAKLSIFDPSWGDAAASKDCIALVILPNRRWSAMAGSEAKTAVDKLMAAGAKAVVLISTGPTGEAIALNAPDGPPIWDRPVAVLAPQRSGPFLKAAAEGREGRLDLTGLVGRRQAFNVIGELQRGKTDTLVLSTPRSGWFTATGERGSGLAAWLELVRWAARTLQNVNLSVIATSGHEYDNTGGAKFLARGAPPPDRVALWVHLGANVATRDWQEFGGAVIPLPSADPQRHLMCSPEFLPACRSAFAGQPGLEAPRDFSGGAAGELVGIRAAGYTRTIGVFGSHRYHHTRSDDLRCVSPALVQRAATGFQVVISAALERS